MEIVASTYSGDLRNLIMYLLAPGQQQRPKSVNDLMPMIGETGGFFDLKVRLKSSHSFAQVTFPFLGFHITRFTNLSSKIRNNSYYLCQYCRRPVLHAVGRGVRAERPRRVRARQGDRVHQAIQVILSYIIATIMDFFEVWRSLLLRKIRRPGAILGAL